MWKRVQSVFMGPRGPFWFGVLAVLLSLPALALGMQSDDHVIGWTLQEGARPWGLFRAGGALLEQGRANGAIAWWASPRLSIMFLRPLASLTHYVDFTYWPDAAWLMSLINVLLYGGCAWVAALLFRRLSASHTTASLAALFFTVNEAHAMSVGWISGRNTLIALLCALLALLLHVRARRAQPATWSFASAAVVAAGLLSAEAGVWSMGLLLAYACVLEPGGIRARLTSVAPQLAVGLIWAGAYLWLGCGVRGSSFYRELSSPLSTLLEGVLDLPLSLTSLFGPSVIGFALLAPANLARLMALPVAALCVWLVWPGRRPPSEWRFYGLAAALCLLPSFLTVAQDRVVMGASFAACGWIAWVIVEVANGSSLGARIRRRTLLVLHVIVPLLTFPMNLASVRRFENGTRALAAAVVPGHDVVLLNTPVELLSNYVIAKLDRPGRRERLPASLHQLYAGGSELWVERVDANTLDVVAARGWGYTPIERIFCAPSDMPVTGSERNVHHLAIRVVQSTPDGRPQRVRFRFPTALESAERQWLMWQSTGPVAFLPPKLGERVRIAPMLVLSALEP